MTISFYFSKTLHLHVYQVMWDELSPVEWEQKLLTALKIQEQEDDMIKERHEMDEVARATEVVDGKRKKSNIRYNKKKLIP